ncbi:MAG: superoxide dismutase family protein [Gemmatimonadales bacterium]
MRVVILLLTGLGLVSCTATPRPRPVASAPWALASLRNGSGEVVGLATLTEEAGRVRVLVEATLPPGKHGIHLHEVGTCDPAAFTSAGGHHNPLGGRHGLESPGGPHAGDLPNLDAGPVSPVRYEVVTDRVTLRDGPASLFDADGSALVIHAVEDDQRTDPAGNSGARLVCGVIKRAPR